MATPKGVPTHKIPLKDGDRIHVYEEKDSIVLQLRREVPTAKSRLDPSFKSAVELSPAKALKLASRLSG